MDDDEGYHNNVEDDEAWATQPRASNVKFKDLDDNEDDDGTGEDREDREVRAHFFLSKNDSIDSFLILYISIYICVCKFCT